MIIRKYRPDDCAEIAELFYNTVHTINSKDYTARQLNAWADGKADLSEWNKSFSAHFTVVAVKNDIIIGFGDIDESGYLDRLYVHKDYQRHGVAAAICDKLENAFDVNKITVHASVTAKPFFEHRGYKVIRKQEVIRKGVGLTNYIMEKHQ
ncbi:MAG: GNAT family N-acetyltransferase [Candidatus Ornithomonoglobus sp.]